ncbi:hypothetical protein ACFOZ5_05785 [Marinobacter lacisalsi]|uniref:Uncharacterized protein n=1 Tax=Marinobacter lacisalsi TaxID=475979 RepID=A0ABV8QDZ2_9GAMM
MSKRRLDLNRLTDEQLAELFDFTQDEINRFLKARFGLGGFASLDAFVERFRVPEDKLTHPRYEYYVEEQTEPGVDPMEIYGPEPALEGPPEWSLAIDLVPKPPRGALSPVHLRLEYKTMGGEAMVSEKHSMPLDRETSVTIDPVDPETRLFVVPEDAQGHRLLPRQSLTLEADEKAFTLRARFELDTEVLEDNRGRAEPEKKRRLQRRGRFRLPLCPEARFDDFDLTVDLVDSAAKAEAVMALLGQEEGTIPQTGTRQLDPADEQKLEQLTRFNLTAGDLKFDGGFEFSRPLPTSEDTTVLGWFWLLMGPTLTVGFRREEDPQEPASRLTLLMPMTTADEHKPGSRAGKGCGPDDRCGGGKTDYPLDVDEQTLLDHPDRFSDDPGPFCRPFENPNRIMSERSFHTILRVEEPDIASNSPKRPDYLLLLPEQHKAIDHGYRKPRTKGLKALDRFLPNPRPGSSVTSFFPNPFQKSSTRQPAGTGNLIDWEGDPTRHQAQSVVGGHILEWRVQTRSNGYSLGDVKRTLTLAPRQTRRIVKVDWERREIARRQEQTISDDEFAHELEREMDYGTAVESNLSEWSRGGSESKTTGAAGGLGFASGGFVIGGGASHGRSSSNSWTRGGRSIAATEEQKLRDAVRQYGDSLRALESTVVTEAEQDETVEGVSEVVRNINYCHSLSVIYYEIVRHLRVDTMLGGVRECLFVPFAITPFTEDRVLRWREVLQRYLRPWRMRWALRYAEEMAAVADTNPDDTSALDEAWGDVPAGARKDHELNYLSGSLWIRLGIERPREGEEAEELEEAATERQYRARRESNIIDAFAKFVPLLGDTIQETARDLNRADEAQIDDYFRRNVAPTMARNWVEFLELFAGDDSSGEPLQGVNFTLASSYRHKGLLRVDFTLPTSEAENLTRQGVEYMTVKARPLDPDDEDKQSLPPGSIADCSHARIHYETRHDTNRRVSSDRRMRNLVQTGSGKPNDLGGLLYFSLSAYERRNMRDDIQEAYDAVLTHLNNNMHRYHRAIWLSMDRNELHTILDGYALSDTDSRSLASVVEHQPIGVLGNSLIFRVAAGAFVGVDDHESLEEAFNYYNDGSRAAQPMRVTLPSDGVYAQALMDHCNSCEEHHGSTDWVLDQEDPELASLPNNVLQSRREPPGDLTPSNFPSPMINLQNAPSVPATQGLSQALSGVTESGAFRDMAGLEGTQQNARAGMEQAAGLASQFGKTAAALEMEKQKRSSTDLDQYRSALERGVEKGFMTQEQANERFDQRAAEVAGAGDDNDRQEQTDAQLNKALDKKIASGQPFNYTRMDGNGYSSVSSGAPEIQQASFLDIQVTPLVQHVSNNGLVNTVPARYRDHRRASQTQIARIGPTGIPGIDAELREAARAAKCEYHGVTFSSTQSQEDLFSTFRSFVDLIDPAVVSAERVHGSGSLAVGDRFRFVAEPDIDGFEFARDAMARMAAYSWSASMGPVGSSLVYPLEKAISEVADYMTVRRFEVEVITLEEGSNEILMTVQTLENHPYAGRRSWRLKRLDEENQWRLETAEFNTFPWLMDYLFEHLDVTKGGEMARQTWVRYLEIFLEQANATVEDDSDLAGDTHYTTRSAVRNGQACQNLLEQWSDLKEEAEHMSSNQGNGGDDSGGTILV